MSETTPYPAEREQPNSDWESLFPIPTESIERVRDRLLRVTDDDLSSFISVRRDGRSNDPMTIMYGVGLSKWHMEHGDFTGRKSILMYQVGKLYGAQLALDRYRELTGKPLVADDADAYEAAKYTVFESYRGLKADTQWEQDFMRERRSTGGKTLALLNASLHDRTMMQFHKLYGEHIPPGEALESFYTGLLDASIFIDAYAQYRDKNRLPSPAVTLPEDSTEEMPEIARTISQQLQEMNILDNTTLQLDTKDAGFGYIVSAMLRKENPPSVRHIRNGGRLYEASYYTLMEQVGPNEFTFTMNMRSIHEIRRAKAQRMKYIGGLAMVGAGSTHIANLWQTSPSASVVIGSMIIGGVIGSMTGVTVPVTPRSRHIDRQLIWRHP